MLRGLREGRLSEARVEEAVTRVLAKELGTQAFGGPANRSSSGFWDARLGGLGAWMETCTPEAMVTFALTPGASEVLRAVPEATLRAAVDAVAEGVSVLAAEAPLGSGPEPAARRRRTGPSK